MLLLSVLLVVVGGYAARARDDARPPQTSVVTPASVTQPVLRDPVVVQGALSPNDRGWGSTVQAVDSDAGVRSEVMAAYQAAASLAPPQCHLSVSLLAAIGQVESGNLAGHTLEGRRAVPAVIGPVLDGKDYAAIADTDEGEWDGNRTWDRALGPMQFLPATWRVVGLDMDADGVRDPQNIYDAAGAAMVYLCDGGRDLGTREGLVEAVLAYNHSRSYLRQVLAWKTVFDAADLIGFASQPAFGAWAAPADAFAPMAAGTPGRTEARADSAGALAAPQPSVGPATSGDRAARTGGPAAGGATASTPSAPRTGSLGTVGQGGSSQGPGKDPGTDPGKDPGKGPSQDPGTGPSQDPGKDPGAVDGGGLGTDPDKEGTEPGAGEPPVPTCTIEETAQTLAPDLDLESLETPACCLLPDGTTVVIPTDAPPAGEETTLPEACVTLTALPADPTPTTPAG